MALRIQTYVGPLYQDFIRADQLSATALVAYRPLPGYLLLDEQRLAQGANLPARNLSAALFRLDL